MNPVSIYRLTILNPPIKYRPSGSIYYGRDILKPSIIVITIGEGVQNFMAAIFRTPYLFQIPIVGEEVQNIMGAIF